MKAGVIAAIFLAVIALLNWPKAREPVTETLKTANFEAVKVLTAPAVAGLDEINKRAYDQVEKSRKAEYDARKVKVYVEGRDTKTCMKVLKTNAINNKVVDCNKDRTIEMRQDEVEAFKMEQGI